jgi:hypothetical protein
MQKLINFFRSFSAKPRTQLIYVKDEGIWLKQLVSNPVSFSELDEMFGEGNWRL